MALFDATVGPDAYRWIGSQIDKMAGHSVGQYIYSSISGILNNFKN